MDARADALRTWAQKNLALDAGGPSWQMVAGDASNRRYFRLRSCGNSWICVDAPPATEKNAEFLAVRALLEAGGILVPALFGFSEKDGFLLLGDLGEQLLLPLLAQDTVAEHYARALDTLSAIQQIPLPANKLPDYSAEVLREELQRFPQWFCGELLHLDMGDADLRMLRELEDRLVACALEQPQVLVHRDYHSRNLMLQPDARLGVIDFQDALRGPLCYDLVSLLRDCYIRWPQEQVRAWALDYYRHAQQLGLCPVLEEEAFIRWFDWIGLQRHLKVLGNFSRLAVRDGRPQYLPDMPLVLRYINEVLEQYPEFAMVNGWFKRELAPRVAEQAWSSPA